jgi:hypothetical protein
MTGKKIDHFQCNINPPARTSSPATDDKVSLRAIFPQKIIQMEEVLSPLNTIDI